MSPDVQKVTDMAISYKNCSLLQVCDCASLKPLYDDDNDEFYTLSEDIWKKFELLPTPPLSPINSNLYELSEIDETRTFDISEYFENDAIGTFPESPPSPSLHSKLIQDCMWSDPTCAGKPNCDKSPNSTTTNCDVQSVDCVDPASVFPYPITNISETETKKHSLGIETPSDSEEEIDVVTVEKQKQAAAVKRKTPVVNIISVDSTEEKSQQTVSQLKFRIDTLSHCHNYSLPHPGLKRIRSLPCSPESSPRPSKRSRKELSVPDLRQAVQKLKSCSSRNSSDSEEGCEGKRTQHNVLERKRRNDLKYSFFTLRDSVPELFKQERAAKVVILRKAADYISSLCTEHEKLSLEKDSQKSKNEQLKKTLARLRGGDSACF